jgi:hypothetical protein
MTRGGPPHDDGSETSRLADLLACEGELERLWTIAEQEARARVEAARRAADRQEAELDRSLAAELEEVSIRLREQARERIREQEARERERADRYDAVSDLEVSRLADVVFRLLVARERPR